MEWHPVIDAVEGPTGAWHLLDASGARIGRIELRRVMNGAELRYRVEFRGDVIGWAVSLRTACERLNQAYLRTHGPGGGAMADWGEASRRRAADARAVEGHGVRGGNGAPASAPPRHGGGRPSGRPPP